MINLKTKKIIVPYDFSKTAENAVKHAAFIAAYTKGELILVYVQKKNDLLDILNLNSFFEKMIKNKPIKLSK